MNQSTVSLFAALILVAVYVAEAQQTEKTRVIGILSISAGPALRVEVFKRGLRELGWLESQNLRIEYRWAANKFDRLSALAEELVRLKVDLIVALGTVEVRAAKNATQTIPIVSISADPVGNGFVASLARPGGNITGVSMMMPELAGKQLQLLRELSPKLSRVATLAHGSDPSHRLFVKEAQAAGESLGIHIQPLVVERSDEFEGAFSTMRKARVDALIIQPIFITESGPQIAELAVRNGLPTISHADVFADAGGLIRYGPDPLATYQRVATYVDRILKGANPAELPVEQPQKFALVINLKTAKRLGVRVPQLLLFRADKVIE